MSEISTLSPTYAPSWFDRFTDWVDALTIPAALFYAVFAAILVIIQIATQWNGGVYAFPLVYIIAIPYALALMHHLDQVAAQSLARFRPLLSISDAEYDDLLYRLTTLPTRPTLLAVALGALNGISVLSWIPYPLKISELHFAATALSINFNHAISLVIWAIMGVLLYHTLHQLRVVQQIYKRCSGINLYKLGPLYAFSSLSARTAVGIALIVYLWYLCAPLLFNIGIAGLIFFTVLSLLTFVLPLEGARRLLVEAKDQQMSENGERQRIALTELHHRVDSGEMVDMDNLNKTISSLELEHTVLDRISTWPWKPETLRGVAAALFFPVIVWLTQWVLQRLLE